MNNYKIEYQEIKTPQGILRGLYTTPTQGKKNIVLMFHGFTGHKNENGFLFKQITSDLVEKGYATLRFDFMGSGDSDGDFKDMTFLTEVMDAKEIIKRTLELNNNKPFILLGFSCGGAISGFLANEYQDNIEKLILLSPAGNMNLIAKMKFDTLKMDKDGNVDLGGYCLNIKFLKSFDNLNLYQNLEKFTKPTLICHGEEDTSVPIAYGKKYHKIIPNNEFHKIKGSPHCYTKVELRTEVRNYIKEFLKD